MGRDKKKLKEWKQNWYQTIVKPRRIEYFKDKVCSICGGTEKLELHHIDPSTKIGHCIWSWSEQRRKDEINKCQPLCRKCHQELHGTSLKTEIVHGTHSGYRRGCRCDLCRAHQSNRLKEYRKNKL